MERLYLSILSYLKIGRFLYKDTQKRFVNMSLPGTLFAQHCHKDKQFLQTANAPRVAKTNYFYFHVAIPPKGSADYPATSWLLPKG